MLKVGEKIKIARKDNGLKQSELATILSEKYPELAISNTTISNYEVGRSKPDIQTLNAIRQVLGLGKDYFFEDDEIKNAATTEGSDIPADRKPLIDFLISLDKQTFDTIQDVAFSIGKKRGQ